MSIRIEFAFEDSDGALLLVLCSALRIFPAHQVKQIPLHICCFQDVAIFKTENVLFHSNSLLHHWRERVTAVMDAAERD